MKIVIQCAGRKVQDAGALKDANGQPVLFVANPALAPPAEGCTYARPDDPAGNGLTWREFLVQYNYKYRRNGANPSGLLPAYQLYAPEIYRQLVARFCVHNVFILSAGWGLIRADFLTPKYDITFSASAHRYRRRSILDPFSSVGKTICRSFAISPGNIGARDSYSLTRVHRPTRLVVS